MKKILSLITICILISGCGVKRNIDHHGVHQLEKKNKLLFIGETNKNDMFQILGPPSVESTFDTDVLFYIERKIITNKASGFLYYVTVTGITGQKSANLNELKNSIKKIRQFSKLPIVAGFGINNKKNVNNIIKRIENLNLKNFLSELN